MKESTLRKWHRRIGVTLALFIVLQAGSGLIFSFTMLTKPHDHAEPIAHNHDHESQNLRRQQLLKDIHHGGGDAGNIYRIIIGLGVLGMAASGTAIFYQSKHRTKSRAI